MKDVITTGTGKLCNFEGMALAGKSGTTTKNRDALFAGYSPYYTCVVWGGFDDNTPQASGQTSYPKLIWKAVMQRLHENLEYKDFTQPSGITTCQVCKKSGKLAVEGVCDRDPRGSQVTTEYFAAGTEPEDYCDVHVAVTTCTASGMPAGPYCPSEYLRTTAYISGAEPGSQDSPYALPSNLSTNTCNVHTISEEAEPVDITGDTGREDENEGSSDNQEESHDSHRGSDDDYQVLIDPDDISD
jgi:penicillin-binding protein 1A